MRARIVRAGKVPTRKAPEANFVGTVLHEEVFAPEAPSKLRASRVSFAPGGRTNGTPTRSARSSMCFPAWAATKQWASPCR